MGNKLCQRCCLSSRKAEPARSITLAAFGLDNAGKTSVVKAIKGESLADVAPTVGFASNKFKHDKYDVTIYDVGGGSRIRGIWKNYFAEIHGLIYVIDSSDKTRTEENRNELQKLLSHPRIQSKPLLLLLNKRDIDGSMDENDVKESLNLESMVTANRCHCKVELCSASKGVGKLADTNLKNGFEWLIAYIVNQYDNLAKKVELDLIEQKAELEQEKLLRMERIKKAKAERGELEDAEELPGQTVEPSEGKLNEKHKIEDNVDDYDDDDNVVDNTQGDDEPEIKKKPPMIGNGDARDRRSRLAAMGQNGAVLASRHPSWKSTPMGDGIPLNTTTTTTSTSVPTLPPISLSPAARIPPAAPPPSRIEINRQRRISVESINQNSIDYLPNVHKVQKSSMQINGHVPNSNHYSNNEAVHSADSSSTSDLTKVEDDNNPRKRRRQKRLGRFNKTAPSNNRPTAGGDSVESSESSSQQPPPFTPRLPVPNTDNDLIRVNQRLENFTNRKTLPQIEDGLPMPSSSTIDNDLIRVNNHRLQDFTKTRRLSQVEDDNNKLPPVVHTPRLPKGATTDKELIRHHHLEDINETATYPNDDADPNYQALSINDNGPTHLPEASINRKRPSKTSSREEEQGAETVSMSPPLPRPPPPTSFHRLLPDLNNASERRLERIELPKINLHKPTQNFEGVEEHSNVRRQSEDSVALQSNWALAEDL